MTPIRESVHSLQQVAYSLDDTFVSSKLINKDGCSICSCDCIHGVKAEGEVLAAHKLLDGGEVKDLLQGGQVVCHAVNHLNLH